jgi:glycosyltransferase involved in cell wall biosynthesis
MGSTGDNPSGGQGEATAAAGGKPSRFDVAFHVPGLEQLLTTQDVLPTGGAQNQVYLLAQALAARGLTVCLLVFDLPEGGVPARAGAVDVIARPRPPTHQRFIGKLRSANGMRKLLLSVRADVVVTRAAGPHVALISLASALLRWPFVYSSASFLDFHWETRFTRRHDRRLFRRALQRADEIVVQTAEQAQLCVERLGRRPVVIGSIAEHVALSAEPRDAFLWVGRAYDNKRPLAFVRLAQAVPEAQFRMVAVPSPGRDDALDELVAAAECVDNLELVPPSRRAQLLPQIARAVAVVNTSDFEGMPNVFLEGWSRGVPALALSFDPDGAIERYGLGGFARGSESRLAELARELWNERDATSELTERCRNYARDNHDPALVAQRWSEVLERVRARGRRA